MNAWVHCLITIAKAFESAGHPQLLGDAENNPIDRWTSTFAKAHSLSDTGRYKKSNAALLEIIDEMGGCVGSAIDTLRPKIYGLLGTNHFRTGEFVKAREYTELALADSERTNDRQGVAVYTENLATLLAMDANSPAAHCRKTIAKAQDLSDKLWYERSNVLLREVSEAIEVHPELRSYQSKVYGLMGFNYFRLGEIQHARDYTERAMQYCREDRDHKGVRVYAENLKVISKSETCHSVNVP
jgi:tetratricopeptide (TPR) repeat protein